MKRLCKGIVLCLFVCSVHASKQYLDKICTGLSGFSISEQDQQNVRASGSDDTYGEITYEGVKGLIEDLKLTKDDVFYDLGCGIGKMVAQVYLESPVKKSVGIELSRKRSELAKKLRERLAKDGKLEHKRALNFRRADISKVNISDATVIYFASTTFPTEFMKKMTEKFASLKPGVRIATLQSLPSHEKVKFVKELVLPMTWSDRSAVYIYQVQP